MAISLYEATIGTYTQILGSVAGYLEKGLAHCNENNIEPQEMVDARLYQDMAPLRFQIVSVALHSAGAIDAVRSGSFSPPGGKGEFDYAGLQKLVADTQTKLAAVKAEELEGLDNRDVTFKAGSMTLPFTAEAFLLSFSLPNFYFHATTGYDILRAKGVKIGKRDFLGRMNIKT